MNWFQNFVSLWSETVLAVWNYKFSCCELVSKFCIFVIWNSHSAILFWAFIVVNWFQNFVSLWSETVELKYLAAQLKLWIGFKILYLCDLKQYSSPSMKVYRGCELVSKFCIFVIWNSHIQVLFAQFQVVNWFQNFVSLWSETVTQYSRILTKSCELVSKFCIFVIWNSPEKLTQNLKLVVNWFQNFVSLWSETVLWRNRSPRHCCELVSKFCIFVIWNSTNKIRTCNVLLWIGFKILYLCDLKQLQRIQQKLNLVVNWFQNFVSLWSETVIFFLIQNYIKLWIGFKILYLCDLKQFTTHTAKTKP